MMSFEEVANYLHFEKKECTNDIEVYSYRGFDFSMQRITNTALYDVDLSMRFNQNLLPNQLRDISKKCKISFYRLDACKYILHLFVKGQEKALDKFKEKLDNLIEWLNENQIVTLSECVICRKQSEEEVEEHLINGNSVLSHHTCFENYKNQYVGEIVENQNNKSGYLSSILLAIVGAFVGVVINWVVLLLTNYIFFLLYLLIPLGSFLGYKLGKGPLNNKSMIIIGSISFVLVIASLFAYTGWTYLTLQAIKESGDLTNLTEEGVELMDKTYFELVLVDIKLYLLSIFACIVGVACAYGYMKKQTNETKLKNIK